MCQREGCHAGIKVSNEPASSPALLHLETSLQTITRYLVVTEDSATRKVELGPYILTRVGQSWMRSSQLVQVWIGAVNVPALCTHNLSLLPLLPLPQWNDCGWTLKLWQLKLDSVARRSLKHSVCVGGEGAPGVTWRVFLVGTQTDMSELMEAEKSGGDPKKHETHSWKAF